MIGHSGGDKICAIGCHHARLSETRTWVMFLHDREHGQDRADDAESKIKGYKEAIERASGTGKVPIENASKGDGRDKHHSRRADEDPLPKSRFVLLPVFQARL